MKAALWLVLACAALSSCKYNPKIHAGVIECDPDGPRCPAPYQCVRESELDSHGLCDLPSGAVADATAAGGEDGRAPAVDQRAADLAATPPVDGPIADLPPSPPALDGGATPDAPAADAALVPDGSAPRQPDAAPDAQLCPPPGRGPDMVSAGAFCIDSTEVTNLQYKAFLDDPASRQLVQPPGCGPNDSYLPDPSNGGGLNVTSRADHPVVNVDWCDAAMFCKWAGKRLCGKIGGGALVPGTAAEYSVSQWMFACTRGGTQIFPYGPTARPGSCNVARASLPINTVPVKSKSKCVGGYEQIFDMVGNAEEWIDLCRVDPVRGEVCGYLGGSYTSAESDANCDNFYEDPRLNQWRSRSFRCCAP